ncbi:MAG: hypothetical protein QF773_10600 [Lentisphaeria bacterium]|nr:hypothetical protein [Lentisphaeria bacterium]
MNILVHGINGCLVYWLVLLTLRAHAQASSGQDQAAAAYVDAIKLAPTSPVLHIAAAVAFEAAGKPTTPLHHAHRAVELAPSGTNAAELLEQLQNLVYTDDAEP